MCQLTNLQEAHDKLINLSEGNEPVHIKAMLQFIYGARYSTMITDDESPEAFITKKPKFHAVVYGKGDKYDVNNLQSYAKTEFTTLLSDALPTAFIPAIPTVYAEALTHDKTLLNRSDKTTVIFSCCQTSYHPADLWEKAILLNEDGDPEKWPHACYSTR